MGWGGESAGPRNTHLRPHPHQPTYLHPGARFMAGAGQSLGTERYKCSGAHLRLLLHLHTRPAHTLPTADTTENLTLGGWEGWRGGNAGSYVSPHLLFKGTYSSSKKETNNHQGIPGVPSVPLHSVRPTETEEAVLSPLLGTAEGKAADYSKDHPSPAPLSCLPGGTGGRGCPGNTEQGTRLPRPGGPGAPGSGRKQCSEEGRRRALMVCGRACQPVGRLAQSQDTEG